MNRLLRRYGCPIEVRWEGQQRFLRAFIQPLRYQNRLTVEESYLPDGYFDGAHCLYIGPAEARIDQLPFDAAVYHGGERYLIKRARLVSLGDEALYLWAVLQLWEEAADEPV